MRIIFFGTPQFAVIILTILIDAGLKPAAVVTAPDRPSGRGQKLTSPPVKKLAAHYAIPILQPDKASSKTFLMGLRNYNADVFVIAAYGKLLPQALLNISPHGTINVHPSLLPAYRGASPIQSAIVNGDDHTGVTLMLTDDKMDHGPIIAVRKFSISNQNITYTELQNTLAKIGGNLLVETLPRWITGSITPQDQVHANATYTKLLTKEDGHINWEKSAIEIDRIVRAFTPWPGAWSFFTNPKNQNTRPQRVKFLAGHPLKEVTFAKPGTFKKTKSGLVATSTGEGTYVIEKLQLEGRRPVSSNIFSHMSPNELSHHFE